MALPDSDHTPARAASLAKVADDASGALPADPFQNFLTIAPWLALWLGMKFIHGGTLALVAAAVLASVAWALFKRIPDVLQGPSPGVWLTSRVGLWRRWMRHAGPAAGLALSLLLALSVGLRGGGGWALGYPLVVAAIFAVQAVIVLWLGRASLAREVELRIDAEGFYSRELGGTLAWDEIVEIAPRRRGDRNALRLVVGPDSAPGLGAERGLRGGPIMIGLAVAGVSRDAVVEAMIAARPALDPAAAPPPIATFVQPIEGVFIDKPRDPDEAAAASVIAGLAVGAILSN